LWMAKIILYLNRFSIAKISIYFEIYFICIKIYIIYAASYTSYHHFGDAWTSRFSKTTHVGSWPVYAKEPAYHRTVCKAMS
jgi:hypothetical protein